MRTRLWLLAILLATVTAVTAAQALYHYRRPQNLALRWRDTPPTFEELRETATGLLGIPYLWGGTGPDGYDCSGFVNKVFADNGYALPRVSRDMARVGVPIKREEIEPGDLLFFSRNPDEERIVHVGMALGDGEFIHAASGQGEVVINGLDGRYYSTRLVKIRRVLGLPPGVLDPEAGGASRAPLKLDEIVIGYDWSAAAGRAASAEAGTGTASDRPAGAGTGTGTPGGEASGGPGRPGRPGASASDQGPRPGRGRARAVDTVEEPAPPWYARGRIRSVVPQVGPRGVERSSHAIGLRLGYGYIDGTHALLATPHLGLFFPDLALRCAFAFPVGLGLAGPQQGDLVNRDGYGHWRRYTVLIQQLRWGHKESAIYLDLSRTGSGTLGPGQLMRAYTPNVRSRQIPGWNLAADALSLSFDVHTEYGGGELFIDDVFGPPTVMGARLYGNPWALADAGGRLLKSLAIGATYGLDRAAPYRAGLGTPAEAALHAAGLDVGALVYDHRNVDLTLYLDGSGLFGPQTAGLGGALGLLLRGRVFGKRTHWLRLRVEGRLHQAAFLPAYFDATYAQERERAGTVPVALAQAGTKLPKLVVLERRAGGPSAGGLHVAAAYSYQRRLTLGIEYEDGWYFSDLDEEGFGPRSLTFSVDWRYVRIPYTRLLLDVYLAYHLRHFQDGSEFFAFDTGKEYLTAALSLKLWKYLFLNGGVRVGYKDGGTLQAADDEVAVDSVVDLSFEYPF